MAVDGRMRRRSRPMPTSSKMMKPSGGIRGVVNSGAGSRSGKCADHGIRTHAGASASVGNIVKPDVVDSSVKPSSVDSDEEEWIYIRGCRIHRAGLRFDSKGEVYVPDSEDDESSVEVNHVVATNGATDVDLAPAVKCSLFMVCINRKYCYKKKKPPAAEGSHTSHGMSVVATGDNTAGCARLQSLGVQQIHGVTGCTQPPAPWQQLARSQGAKITRPEITRPG